VQPAGAEMLSRVPLPAHPEHHFIFDHAKCLRRAAGGYVLLGDYGRAEEHAFEVITRRESIIARQDRSTLARVTFVPTAAEYSYLTSKRKVPAWVNRKNVGKCLLSIDHNPQPSMAIRKCRTRRLCLHD
jgi:hypothetical protein